VHHREEAGGFGVEGEQGDNIQRPATFES
jgi:hypothetical protein